MAILCALQAYSDIALAVYIIEANLGHTRVDEGADLFVFRILYNTCFLALIMSIFMASLPQFFQINWFGKI